MRLVALLTILFLGLAGVARAEDGKPSASAFMARHGLASTQLAQGQGCANKCQLPSSDGGASCDIPTASGSSCTQVGTGCNCWGGIINAPGIRHGMAVKQ